MTEAWHRDPRARDGRCACGAVRFRLTGPVRHVVDCHCSICRRWHGHYGAYTAVDDARFALLAGDVATWRASEKLERAFCPRCGSSLWATDGARHYVCAGTLDDTEGLVTVKSIYVDDAPSYYSPPRPDRLAGECVTAVLDALPERVMIATSSGESLGTIRELSDALGMRELHVWTEVLAPGHRSATPHVHSRREEIFVVTEGTATVHHGDRSFAVSTGAAVGFQPGDPEPHTLSNETDAPVAFIGMATLPQRDAVVFAGPDECF